jgi:hypothetical protein
MASVSDLARIYQATFGTPPSATSTAALLRMEQLLGLTQEDPLARMLIVQLRVADQVAESYGQRSKDDKEFTDELRFLLGELHGLTAKVGEARARVGRYRGRHDLSGGDPAPVEIEAYRKASPLWSYLAVAFRRRTGVDDADGRISAARIDLLYAVFTAAILVLGGMVIGRLLG